MTPEIKTLIQKYENNISNYRSADYNETLLRNDFLDPFFEALGWDIKNTASKPTNEREVILEESLRDGISETSKKPDYTFRLFSERKFFLEAKKPYVKIQNTSQPAKQIRRYGFTAKLKISVLSNFEYLAIYDCSQKVHESDTHQNSLIKLYHFSEYEECFDEINQYLGNKSVYSGLFDQTWEHIENEISKFSVDSLFLQQINNWRLMLGQEIYNHDSNIDEHSLNDIVQSYLNSIIFLRVCEDRNLEEYKTLLNFATNEDFKSLINKFEEADKKYNSGLFENLYKEKIISDNQSIFWEIINSLYYPESPYSFSIFSSDILGNIYEIFLAQKLYIINREVILRNKPENIDKDIITTPSNIINDILRSTIIPFTTGKTDEEILNSKVSDIACGSGAFLLEAFQLISDIVIDYYLVNDNTKLIQTSINTYKLPFTLKKKILLCCIHGIDKDYNAVQACKFGLLLKLLEGEDSSSIGESNSILPSLENNIFFGNSLLSNSETSPDKYIEINPFEFQNKFDVIIGNPPYLKSEDMRNITPHEFPLYKKYFYSSYKQFDKYFLFIEKGLSLLNQNGYLGFVVPNKFTKVGSGKQLREILRKSKNIAQIISFGANQIFADKTTYTCLLTLEKRERTDFQYHEIENLKEWKTRDVLPADFANININTLNDDLWTLVPTKLDNVFKKILNNSITLGDLIGSENIFNGIQTSANKIYVHKPVNEDNNFYYFEKNNKNWKIEKQITRPYFQTSSGEDNLYTYRKLKPNSFVIYPYEKESNRLNFIDIEDLKIRFPHAFQYLLAHKEELSKRDIQPKPITDNEWYRYGRHQSLEKCEVEQKIIVGVLSAGNKYSIDTSKTLISSGGTAGYCIITPPNSSPYSPFYIQALLNSKYIEWYSSIVGEVFRGGYIARGTKTLKRLPIRVIDFNNDNERNLHDDIVRTQQELIAIQEQIDYSSENPRTLIPLKRQFNNKKDNLDNFLNELFALGEEDSLVPIISNIYETH